MRLKKDRVIILKSIDFSEADKILTVYGRNRGKFSLISKGVRKLESKNRGAVQTLSLSSVTYHEGRNLGVLIEATLEKLDVLTVTQLSNISKVLFLMNKLFPEDDPSTEVFDKLEELLYSEMSIREVNRYRIWVLEKIGFLDDLRNCTVCSNSIKPQFFILSELKSVCRECSQKSELRNHVIPITSLKYESAEMDQAIDNYVLGLIG